VDLSRWPHLELLLEAARSLPFLQVWLFGSAFGIDAPMDVKLLTARLRVGP
jgi:hypothetical protein